MNSYNLHIFIAIWSVAFLLTRLGLSRMFKLAGMNPLLAWIPIANWWYWIKIVGRPKWYMIGMVIPGLNILFSFNIKLDLLRSFGKNGFWEQFAGIVLTFAYFPYLFFDKTLKFIGSAGKKNGVRNMFLRVAEVVNGQMHYFLLPTLQGECAPCILIYIRYLLHLWNPI